MHIWGRGVLLCLCVQIGGIVARAGHQGERRVRMRQSEVGAGPGLGPCWGVLVCFGGVLSRQSAKKES